MKRLSFKLPGALRRRVSAKARRSCADLSGKLVGSVRGGPRDASTNKRHLDEAILADYLERPGKRRGIVLTPVRMGRTDLLREKLAGIKDPFTRQVVAYKDWNEQQAAERKGHGGGKIVPSWQRRLGH